MFPNDFDLQCRVETTPQTLSLIQFTFFSYASIVSGHFAQN